MDSNHIRILELESRVAELTRANERLADTDRRKDQLLVLLAHDLRNPLAALAAAAEFLPMPDLDAAQRERIDGVIVRQVQRLAHLIDDLLDVARILRDRIELHMAAVDLQSVLAHAVETARPQLNARGHHLQVSLPAQRLPLHADTTRLVQVFANLLNNAAKFTPDGGRISILAELKKRNHETGGGTSPDDVVVCVRDNGVGLAAEVVPQVFDLFVPSSTSPDRSPGGLGVGLTLVRRLVRLHGGSVWARSEGQGMGSDFFVRLPLAAAPAAAEAQHPADSHAACPRPRHRI